MDCSQSIVNWNLFCRGFTYCTSAHLQLFSYRYTIVFEFYALALVIMLLIRPWICRKYLPRRSKMSIYAAMYFIPILTLLHAIIGGLLCKYFTIIKKMSIAVKFTCRLFLSIFNNYNFCDFVCSSLCCAHGPENFFVDYNDASRQQKFHNFIGTLVSSCIWDCLDNANDKSHITCSPYTLCASSCFFLYFYCKVYRSK